MSICSGIQWEEYQLCPRYRTSAKRFQIIHMAQRTNNRVLYWLVNGNPVANETDTDGAYPLLALPIAAII